MIVMKFGGTSVEDAAAIRRLVSIVRRQLNHQPVVVVSAMGKTTNGLLECARLAAEGRIDDEVATKFESLATHHLKTAEELALPAEKEELCNTVNDQLAAIWSFLQDISCAQELTPQASDRVASEGELLSSLIVAGALRADGMNGWWVDVRTM